MAKEYFKQKNSFSCGPISILNALVWAGKKVLFGEDYKKIEDLCHTKPKYEQPIHYGTHRDSFEKALRIAGKGFFTVVRRRSVDTQEFYKILDEGKSIIALYAWDSEESFGAHYVFVFKQGSKYMTANMSSKYGPLQKLRDRRLRYMLALSNDEYYSYPTLWVLNKNIENN